MCRRWWKGDYFLRRAPIGTPQCWRRTSAGMPSGYAANSAGPIETDASRKAFYQATGGGRGNEPTGRVLPCSWNRANCFRRKRFSATNAARGRAARATNTTKSKATNDKVRRQCATAKKLTELDMDRPGSHVTKRYRPAITGSDGIFAELQLDLARQPRHATSRKSEINFAGSRPL